MISGVSPFDRGDGNTHFFCHNESAVGAAQAHCHAAVPVDQSDDFLVHLANQNHFDDIQSFLIGDAHAAHVAAGDAHLVQHRIDLWSASVHHHRIDTDVLEQHDVLRKARLELFVFHRVAAVLDDEGLAVEALKVRQCLHQHFRLADKVLHPCRFPDQRI